MKKKYNKLYLILSIAINLTFFVWMFYKSLTEYYTIDSGLSDITPLVVIDSVSLFIGFLINKKYPGDKLIRLGNIVNFVPIIIYIFIIIFGAEIS